MLLPRFQAFQLLDERRALQIQQFCRLPLVALGAFERLLDERQFHIRDVVLEVDALVGKRDVRREGKRDVRRWRWRRSGSDVNSCTSTCGRLWLNAIDRSTTFSSWRTFPGQ